MYFILCIKYSRIASKIQNNPMSSLFLNPPSSIFLIMQQSHTRILFVCRCVWSYRHMSNCWINLRSECINVSETFVYLKFEMGVGWVWHVNLFRDKMHFRCFSFHPLQISFLHRITQCLALWDSCRLISCTQLFFFYFNCLKNIPCINLRNIQYTDS